ncbi:hypothetical protein R1sor_025784 [Riccia sorocarpa]|uniref:Uncharacterized protein n=1 Tax=Riccia sorocarpa TaxID=122646 RepID=A0ABD3GD95_9MARC
MVLALSQERVVLWQGRSPVAQDESPVPLGNSLLPQERNDRVFRRKITRVPILRLLSATFESATFEIETLPPNFPNRQAFSVITTAKQTMKECKATWKSWHGLDIDTTCNEETPPTAPITEGPHQDEIADGDASINSGDDTEHTSLSTGDSFNANLPQDRESTLDFG